MFDITHVCHVQAGPEQVFKAISAIDDIKAWWTPETEGNAELNGELIFKFGGQYRNKMRVTEYDKDKILEWTVMESVPEWEGTKIRFELDKNEGRTRIKFSHTGYKKQDDFFAQCSFSWAKYMMSIRNLIETGQGNPYDINKPFD